MAFARPSVRSPLARALSAAALAAALCAPHAPAAAGAAASEAGFVWQYGHQAARPGQKSEIVAYDKRTDTLWVAGVVGVDVLDRRSGQLVAHIDVTNFGAVNGVAIHGGLAALAIERTPDRTLPGVVVFVDTRTRKLDGPPVPVGALPDMLTFTPDGRELLVANEGTPNPRPTAPGLSDADPVGSVSIVDVKRRTATTLPVDARIPGYDTLRLFPASMSPYDPEPEYIAVDKTGRKAYVVLQEANGIAVLDLKRGRFERIFSLGAKDFSLPGNEIDPSDREGGSASTAFIKLRSVPVKGLYQPDGIAAYEHRGQTYLVMANEGDARDNGDFDSEDERRGGAGSGAARLTDDPNLARVNLSTVDSARGGPLVKFGGHSFSIRDTDGRVVFDSGSQLDAKAIELGLYDDGRSDNKGVEPEGVALLKISGRVLAFIGLERTLKSAIAVYDVTDPKDVEFLQMIVGDRGAVLDVSPEGLVAFKARGSHYLAVANEFSDTTTLYEIRLSSGAGRDDDLENEDDDGDATAKPR